MEFQTRYDEKTFRAMARAQRRTLRRKSRRRTCISGSLFLLGGCGVAAVLWPPRDAAGWLYLLAVVLAMAAIVPALLWEDQINAFFGLRRMPPGTETARTVFDGEGYCVETGQTESRFSYDRILSAAETADYFILLLSPHHAQALEKQALKGGTEEGFRAWIREKTGKAVIPV